MDCVGRQVTAHLVTYAARSPTYHRGRAMAKTLRSATWERAHVLLTGIVVGVVIVGVLYWAQSVLMPVALAVFLAFLLSPIVDTLERWKFFRVPAVVLTAIFALLVVAAIAWLAVSQVSSLVRDLPGYSGPIKKKLASI